MRKLDPIEALWARKKPPKFDVGDTVDVHVKITEGEKERIQIFGGTVIARRGGGATETFTVRRIVAGEGVERIFPIHSARVADVKVRRHGRVRRAKLHYLRDRVGRATKVAEAVGTGKEAAAEPEAPKPADPAPDTAAEPAKKA